RIRASAFPIRHRTGWKHTNRIARRDWSPHRGPICRAAAGPVTPQVQEFQPDPWGGWLLGRDGYVPAGAFLMCSIESLPAHAAAVKNIMRTLTHTLRLSVVIPTLNAAGTLGATLASLGSPSDVVVADGGSVDGTVAMAETFGARIVNARRGRGSQLASGVISAK